MVLCVYLPILSVTPFLQDLRLDVTLHKHVTELAYCDLWKLLDENPTHNPLPVLWESSMQSAVASLLPRCASAMVDPLCIAASF